MFEHIIKQKVKQLYNRIVDESEFYYLRYILANPNIEASYKSYFDAEADWWLYEDRFNYQNNKNFDLSTPEIQEQLKVFANILKDNIRFTIEDINLLVDSAVKTRLNFICRPRTTLKWFIFRYEPTKVFYEILYRINYFGDNNYIIDGFRKWANNKLLANDSNALISLVEFENIIEKIDNDIIFDFNPEQFVELLEPCFDFFNDNDSEIKEIPYQALIIFLDDKGIFPLVNYLEELIKKTKKTLLSKKDILDCIYKMLDNNDNSNSMENTVLSNFSKNTISGITNKSAINSTQGNIIIPNGLDSEEIFDELSDEQLINNNEEIDNNIINEALHLKEDDNLIVDFSENIIDNNFDLIENNDELIINNDKDIESNENLNDLFYDNEIEIENKIEEKATISEESDLFIKEDLVDYSSSIDNTESINNNEIIDEYGLIEENIEINSNEINIENNLDKNIEANEISEEENAEEKIEYNDDENELLQSLTSSNLTNRFISVEEEFNPEVFDLEFTDINISENKIQPIDLRDTQNLINQKIESDSLTKIIDDKTEAKLIKKLFKDEPNKYFEIISIVDSSRTWNEAARQIDIFFAFNDIDPMQALAIEFIEIVKRKFLN